MEDYPTAIWGQVVGYVALEFLAFEKWSGFLCEVVEMFASTSAERVGGWIDSYFYFVDELEERFKEGSIEILAPYLFAHL